jgi:hypothetical protein
MLKITNGVRTNLHEWVEIITLDYIEEQVIEEKTSVDIVKDKFYSYLHEIFLCIAPSILHKFLLERGVGHIFEYQPLLNTPLRNSNYERNQRKWEDFLEVDCKDTHGAWDFFLEIK